MSMRKSNINGSLLTKQELLILKLMAKESSNKQIAAELFISIETIKTHLKNIYKKLEVNNKISALVKNESFKNTTKGGLFGV